MLLFLVKKVLSMLRKFMNTGSRKRSQLWYEILEYIKNRSLEDWHISNKLFNESFIQNAIPEINTALHDLHSKQILHLDLKPSNILIRKTSPFLDLVLTDFGISALISDDCNLTISKRRGTPLLYGTRTSY